MNKALPEIDQSGYKVSFDTKKGSSFLCCTYSCIGVFSGIGLACLPCFPSFAKWTIESQDCTVDEKRIHFKVGWFNKEDKLIPLDRIQDVNIIQGFTHRMFGVSQIDIQTAGNSGQNSTGAEASLIAPIDPHVVRREIMERRDKLVLGGALSGVDFVQTTTSQPLPLSMDIVQELKEIK
ncbi:hypothetical protein HK103_001036, partial [Boothiomyces macroporosus]